MTKKPRPLPPVRQRAPVDPYFRFALLMIAGVTLLRLLWLAGGPIDLYPDEAQYWIWSQDLAWGYFAKPPLVVWMIAATDAAFGPGDLAVKLGAPLTYVATSIVVFRLAARLYDRQIAAWAAAAFITLPAVSLSSVIISTDVPLLFFWALATYGFVRAREAGGGRWWLLVGLAGGLGLLSKYAMGFWLLSALGFLALVPAERRHLKGYLAALGLAALIYAPNFGWNAAHGFASYRHTEANANLHGFALHPFEFLEFAGSQFLVFGPIFLATLIVIIAGGRRALADQRTALLLVFALPTLTVMLCEAALSRAQPNWSAPTYITATILVVAWLSQRGRSGLMQWSVVLHILMAVLAFGARDIANAAGLHLPGRDDPLHRVRGWHVLGRSFSQVRHEHADLPLLADQRELMAALIYYGQPHPFDMVMWNPSGSAHNGFEMTQSLPNNPGGDYLWVTERKDWSEVFACFDRHEQVAHILVPLGPGLSREVTIFALRGFKGYAAALEKADMPASAPDAAH